MANEFIARNGIISKDNSTVTGSLNVTGGITGSTNFNTLVNRPTLVSGSSQITYGGLTGIPAGIVSGSSQVAYSGISAIPSGIVSSSGQVVSLLPTGTVSGSSQITISSTTGYTTFSSSLTATDNALSSRISAIEGGVVIAAAGFATTSSNTFNGNQIINGWISASNGITGSTNFNTLVNTPTLVSGSSQITYGGLTGIPTGIVSGSTQVKNLLPGGTVSASAQITYSGISGIPSGIVSGSSQVTISSTTGYTTFSSSLTATDTALSSRISAIEGGIAGTFATTGSNTFTGNQTIYGTVTQTSSGYIENIFERAGAARVTNTLQSNSSLYYTTIRSFSSSYSPASIIRLQTTTDASPLIRHYIRHDGDVRNYATTSDATGSIVYNSWYLQNGTRLGYIGYPSVDNSDLYLRNDPGYGGLRFQTNNADRLYISSSGNVGIGTLSPSSKLHILTTAGIASNIESTTTGNSTISYGAKNATGQTIQLGIANNSYSNSYYPTILPNAGYLYAKRDLGLISDTGSILFQTNGTEKIRVTSDGKLGIGTTSPSGTVHIYSSDANTLFIERSGIGKFQVTPSSVYGGTPDLLFAANQASSGFWFRTNDASNNLINTLILRPNGNVGIGTTNPSSKLEVIGNINAIGAVTASGGFNGTTTNSILFDGAPSSTYAKRGAYTYTNLTAGNWYTIATNAGSRASAKFILNDLSSGAHQSVHFYASHMYGSGNEITLLHGNRYSTSPYRYIRIKDGGTHDGAMLQIYIDSNSTNGSYVVYENDQTYGWTLCPPTLDGVDPGGLGNFANLTTVPVQIDIDQGIIDRGGNIITTGDVYAGGKLVQYKLLDASEITGSTNYVSKFTGANTVGNSIIYDNGTNIGIGTTSPLNKLSVNGTLGVSSYINGLKLLSFTGQNTVVGYDSMNTIGGGGGFAYRNVGVGDGTLKTVSYGADNTALGFESLNLSTTTFNNTAIGSLALSKSSKGNNNIAIGARAGVFIGNSSTYNATPTGSIYIGNNTRPATANSINEIIISATNDDNTIYGIGLGSNTTVIGNSSTTTTALYGNVGIGTTSPSGTVHIYSSDANTLYVERSGFGKFQITPSSAYGGTPDLLFAGAQTSSGYWFRTIDASNNPINTLVLRPNGNVGIGTTNPASKLEVTGNIHSNVLDGFIQSGQNETGIVANIGTTRTYDVTSSNLSYKAYFGYDAYWDSVAGLWKGNRTTLGRKWVADAGYHTDSFRIRYYNGGSYTGWADSAFSDLFVVKGNGNVGIGTKSPTDKFHVVGNGIITGTLNVSGGITASLNGNATTATTLQTGRTINGVSFDGSSNIYVNNLKGSFPNTFQVLTVLANSLSTDGLNITAGRRSVGAPTDISTNYDLQLSSGTNKVTTPGNFGIGTTSPSALLDVNGDAIINGNRIGNGGGNISTNFAAGNLALNSNTTGTVNTALGYAALQNNTSGDDNTAVGGATLTLNTTGYANTGVGRFSMYWNTTGYQNTGIGWGSIQSNTSGYRNTSLGYASLQANTTGHNNTIVGYAALQGNTTGYYNVAVGIEAGRYTGASGTTLNTASVASIYVGANSRALTATSTNEIVIGYGTVGLGSHTTAIGNSSTTTTALYGNVGIGTLAPTYKLQIGTDSAAKPSTNTWTIASDSRIKTNIRPYEIGLDVLEKINPIIYDYNGKAGFGDGKDNVGVIAQDIKDILPNSVSTFNAKLNKDDDFDTELLNFNSHELTYILINAVKKQQEIINQLTDRISELEKRL